MIVGVVGLVAGPIRRLVVHRDRLQDGELLTLDAHAPVGEVQIVLLQVRPDTRDEEDGVALLGVTELDQRRLRPLAAVISRPRSTPPLARAEV